MEKCAVKKCVGLKNQGLRLWYVDTSTIRLANLPTVNVPLEASPCFQVETALPNAKPTVV